jgi:hypothetical protein
MSAKPVIPALKVTETRITCADGVDARTEDIYPDTGEVQVRLFPKEHPQSQEPDSYCESALDPDSNPHPDPDCDHRRSAESQRQNTAKPPQFDPVPFFPAELKREANFMRWNLEPGEGGRLTKKPYPAKDYSAAVAAERWASSTNAATWASFDEVCRSLRETGTEISSTLGIGFALGQSGCGYTVVDLDGCRNSKTGEIAQWARDFMTAHPTYYEISPSGFGFHGVYLGQPLLPNGKMIEQWEMPELPGIRDAGYDKAKTELEVFTGQKIRDGHGRCVRQCAGCRKI